MTKNFETFQEFYNSLNVNFSIIYLSETWTNDKNLRKNSLFQPQGYNRDSILHKSRKDLSIYCNNIESLSIEIINDHSKNIFNVLYRRPYGDLSITET